jgi:predicted dehydrogenase
MHITNWGIIGTGTIAHKFAQGLKAVPGARLQAVASRSPDKAAAFVAKYTAAKHYDTYAALVADAGVDIVYIATPNNLHKNHALLCLDHGKHVLCEKPFTLNEKEAAEVFEQARNKNIFCMEALWTRCLPVVEKAKAILESGALGVVKTFTASFGKINTVNPENALYNRQFGGGSLLDRGVYPLSIALYFLGHPLEVSGNLSLCATGVDDQAAIVLKFPGGVLATLHSSFSVDLDNTVKIYCEKGVLILTAPIYRPGKLKLHTYAPAENLKQKIIKKIKDKCGGKTIPVAMQGNGYNYEAAEAMTCLRQGLIESPKIPHKDSLKVLNIMDTIRWHNGLFYADENCS